MLTSGRNPLIIVGRGLSVILLLPIVALIVVVLVTPLTLSGVLYLIGFIAFTAGIFGLTWGFRRLRWVLWVGLGLILTVALVRVFLLRNTDKIKLLILPEQSTTCWLNCLIDEQDASLVSTRLLPLIGWISPTEQDGLLDAMYAGYRSMAADQPLVASPFLRTYLNLQNSDAFDALIIEPDNGQSTQTGLIFLHGFTGNFTMPCWLMAQAAREKDTLTICPSVSWHGDWWTSNGEATLRHTIDYLHQRGISRIYLAGLSNGGVGISEIAYKFTDQLAGLILINGASLNTPNPNLPTLILAGHFDERMLADMLHAYANQLGSNATFIELQSDHFMLAKEAKEIQADIAAWLHEH